MSNRLHQKNHRYNHHSLRPNQSRDPKYPDAGYDPIASFESPFEGEFYTKGNIITKESLSAEKHIFVRQDLNVKHDIIVDNDATIKRDAFIDRNLIVKGSLRVEGETSEIETVVYITSAVDIKNAGVGPALRIEQSGFQPIAHFIDSNGEDIIFADNGKVGLGTDEPSADLHLRRDIPSFTEVRIQNVSDVGGTVVNLAGPSESSADGAIVQYSNSSGLLQIKNRFAAPSGPSIVFDTQQTQRAISIAPNGRVTIGFLATNPPEVLTVVGNISATGALMTPTVVVSALGASVISVANVNANNVVANTINSSQASITSGNINRLASNSVFTNYLSSQKTFIVWDTATVTALPSTVLSLSANDIELNTNTDVTVRSFLQGIRGATYTLTNVSTNVITITSSPTVFVRQGDSWKSNTSSLSTAFLRLLPNHSCSLRASSNNKVSVW